MKDPELKLQTLLLNCTKGYKYISEIQENINEDSLVPQKCNSAACSKIKSNIRQGLETGNFHQLCVMLDVISHFAKFNNYKEGLPFLLEAGISKFLVMIFEKTTRSLSESDEICHKVTPEVLLERLLDTIADIGENCIKGKAIMVSSFTELLMELAIDTKKNFKTRMEAFKTLNPLLEGIENNAKEILQKTPQTFKLMTSLAKMLYTAGDFEMQVSIIETLFRTTVKRDRCTFAKEWFHSIAESNEFVSIREKQFETDCRKFLNMLNSSMGDRQRVFSLPCVSALLGNLKLEKPIDENLTEFWVDFNTGSHSVTMFVTGDPDDPEQPRDMWETVVVTKDNLKQYSIHEMKEVAELVLTLSKPAYELYYFLPDADSTQLKITFKCKTSLHQVTAACFGPEKLQSTTVKMSLKASVPADSTLMRSKKDDVHTSSVASYSPYQQSEGTSQSQKSSDPHETNTLSDSEVIHSQPSRKGCSGHKVSVPLEIIVTPRSKSAVKMKTPTTTPSSAVTAKSAKCYKVCVSDSEITSAKTPERSKQRPSGRVKTPLKLVQDIDSSDIASNVSSGVTANQTQQKLKSKIQIGSPSEKSITSTTSEFTFKQPLPQGKTLDEDTTNTDGVEIVIPDSLPSPEKRVEEPMLTSKRNYRKEKDNIGGLKTKSADDPYGASNDTDVSDKDSVASYSRRNSVFKSPSLSTVTEESLHTMSSHASQGSDHKNDIKQMEAIQEEQSMIQSDLESMDNRTSQESLQTSNNDTESNASPLYKKDTQKGPGIEKPAAKTTYSLRNRTKEVPKTSLQKKETKTATRKKRDNIASPQQNDSQMSMFDFHDSPQADENSKKRNQQRTKSVKKTTKKVQKVQKVQSPGDSLDAFKEKRMSPRSSQRRMAKQTKTARGGRQKQGGREGKGVSETQSKRPAAKGRNVKTSEFDFRDYETEESDWKQESYEKKNSRVLRQVSDDQSDYAESQESDMPSSKQTQGRRKGVGKGKARRKNEEESRQDDEMDVEHKGASRGQKKPRGKRPAAKDVSKKTQNKNMEELSEEFSDIEIAREAVRVQPSSILKKKMTDDDNIFSRRDLRRRNPVNYADVDTSFDSDEVKSNSKKSGKYNKAKGQRSLFSDNEADETKSVKSDLSWLSEKKKPKCNTYGRKQTNRKSIKMGTYAWDLPESDDSDIEESVIDSILKGSDAPKKKRSFSSRHTDTDEENEREVEDSSTFQYFSAEKFYNNKTDNQRGYKRARKETMSSNEEDNVFEKTKMLDVFSSSLATPKLDATKDREKTPRQKNRRYSPLDVQIMKTPVIPKIDDNERQDSDNEDELQSSQNDAVIEISLTPLTPAVELAEDVIESGQEDLEEDELVPENVSLTTKSQLSLPKTKSSKSSLSSATKSESNTLRIKTPKVLREKVTVEDQSDTERNNLLKSGPAEPRPRRSQLKRKYKDIMSKEDFVEMFGSDSEQDDDQLEEQEEEPVLKPRKLFRRDAVPDNIVGDVQIPSSSAEQTEEDLNESKSSTEEDDLSTIESLGVGKLLTELSAEIKTAMMRRKNLVQKSVNTVVHTTNNEISTALKTDSDSRQKLFHKFNDSILQEMVGFERRLDQLHEVQMDFAELFKKYQRKFSTLLTHNQSSLARIRDMYANFNAEIEKQEECYQEQDRNIQQTMKKELKTMQKNILRDLQQKEIQKMKHALHITLLSATRSTC